MQLHIPPYWRMNLAEPSRFTFVSVEARPHIAFIKRAIHSIDQPWEEGNPHEASLRSRPVFTFDALRYTVGNVFGRAEVYKGLQIVKQIPGDLMLTANPYLNFLIVFSKLIVPR